MTERPTLLHIEVSPRKTRSHSSAVGAQFVETYRRRHGESSVATLDLWRRTLPPVDEALIEAKFAIMSGQDFTAAQRSAWNGVLDLAAEFTRPSALLFTVPMWNRGIPYVLKHYIDVITQPGVLFERAGSTYRPLGPDRPAVVVYASGSDFSPGAPLAPFDFQKPFFDNWLQFVGISRIEQIVVEPTVGNPAGTDRSRAAAMRRAADLASTV